MSSMRYDDWDIILFPVGRDGKIPFKEFKVCCHTVPDLELAHIHGATAVPVMTCFIPSLQPGAPFQISIHCWRNPSISQFTQSYSKHTEDVKFEARILIDGRLVASSAFDREVDGPHLVSSTFEFTKSGEHERLKFPPFRDEIRYQNHWNPVDDIGRIKVIISEGFPRDSLSVPIEHVKNIVVFCFQHAPLEILENNSIAWPNPNMWQRLPLPFSPGITVPTFRPEDGADSHTHSPRRKAMLKTSKSAGYQGPVNSGGLSSSFFGNQSAPLSFLPQAAAAASFSDPFTEPNMCLNWMNTPGSWGSTDQGYFRSTGKSRWPEDSDELIRMGNRRSKESSDKSMPDYLPTQLESMPMPMHLSGPSLEDDRPMSLKVPTNTPTTAADDLQGAPGQYSVTSTIHSDLANSLTHSLLNQPFPIPIQPHNIPLPSSEIKSRKENRHLTITGSTPSSTQSTPHAERTENRKFSQGHFSLGNMGMGHPMSLRHESASINSPRSESTFVASDSRRASTGDYGSNSSSNQNPLNDSSANPLGMGLVNAGIKRTRNFTPASAKAIDEEDEPRRVSPHDRISSFGGDRTNEA